MGERVEREVVGGSNTVGAQVSLRQQLVLHSPATAVLVSQSPRRALHSLSDTVSGYIGSPVHGHTADGDDEGELVVGVAIGPLDDDGADDGAADEVPDDGDAD